MKRTVKHIPMQMLMMLRGRRGLETNDNSQDDSIHEMTPEKIVRECVGWEIGDPSWASKIASYIVSVKADLRVLASYY